MSSLNEALTYYSFDNDSSYRDYVISSRQTEKVVLSIDESTKRIVGSGQAIADRFGKGVTVLSNGVNEIAQQAERGFDKIAFDLNSLQGNFEQFSLICDQGFEKLARETTHTNHLLEELITLFKTPDQVWAREQFENSKLCINKNLWDDALLYINKAIKGDDRNSGYHIEPAFHFLKGKILLQTPDYNDDKSFLELALSSFKDAIKYSGNEDTELLALSFQEASWCSYCLGDFESAYNYISKTVDITGTPLSFYLLSKYSLRLNEINEAFDHLVIAVYYDELLLLRALNDSDFKNSSLNLEKVAENALQDLTDDYLEYLDEVQIKKIRKISQLATDINIDISELSLCIEYLDELSANKSLSAFSSFYISDGDKDSPANVIRDRLKNESNLIYSKILNFVDKINSMQFKEVEPEKVKIKDNYSDIIFLFELILSFIIAYNLLSPNGVLSGFATLILSVILMFFVRFFVSGVKDLIIESKSIKLREQAAENAKAINLKNKFEFDELKVRGVEIGKQLEKIGFQPQSSD